MTELTVLDRARAAIGEARAALAKNEGEWPVDRRLKWNQALDSIDAYLGGDGTAPGFSIIRSLDASGDTDSATAQAIVRVAAALRESGVNRYS